MTEKSSLNITTCFPGAKTSLCIQHPLLSPGPPSLLLTGPKGFYLRNPVRVTCLLPKNVQVVPEEIIGQERGDVYTRVFIAELFVIAAGWKRPKCPTVGAG